MAPLEARIAVFEDDPSLRRILKKYLEDDGHKVVLQAGTMQEALGVIPTLGKCSVQVAVIDGNLREGDGSGRDGAMLNELIKQQFPEIKTIGWSGGEVKGVDFAFGKSEYGEIGKKINEI